MVMKVSPEERQLEERIGARVAIWRDRRGLTACALADLAGLHRNTIWRLEAGICGFSIVILWKIAAVLEVDLFAFIGDPPRNPFALIEGAPNLVHSWEKAVVEYKKPVNVVCGTENSPNPSSASSMVSTTSGSFKSKPTTVQTATNTSSRA
jgi:transcriptional regulator with XRE-family HTH domain